MPALTQAHLFIKGKVQGVFFRWWTRRQAKKLGLKGWVRNLNDGRVEILCQGPKTQVEKMIDQCQQGSPGAKVEEVQVKKEKINQLLADFEIRSTLFLTSSK